jgi:mono/diheme cytochrome c family protein
MYTFALGGKAQPPAFVKYETEGLLEGVPYDPKDVADGTALYVAACATCHGVPGVDKGLCSSVARRPKGPPTLPLISGKWIGRAVNEFK